MSGTAGLLELLQPTALPAPAKVPDIGEVPDQTDAPDLPSFGLDSIDPRIIITPEKEIPDNGIVTLQANLTFTSLTPATLTIDQTDPTDVKLTNLGGSGNINNAFGDPHALWLERTTFTDAGIGGGSITSFTVNRTHPYISYNPTDGKLSFSKAGYYIITVSGEFNNSTRPATAADRVGFFATPTSSTPILGVPGGLKNVLYLGGQSIDTGETKGFYNASFGMFAVNGTVADFKLFSSWGAAWDKLTVTVGSIYGPGTFGEIAFSITPVYAYCQWFDFTNPNQWPRYNAIGFAGAPYGVAGEVSPHDLSTTEPYIGDGASPYWLPDHAMSMSFSISPAPNLVAPIQFTTQAWEGTVPNDLIIVDAFQNNGSGNAIQGFNVILPGGESYTGTGFKILVTIPNVVSNHQLYFKYSPVGQNDCTSSFNNGIQVASYDTGSGPQGVTLYGDIFGTQGTYAIYGNWAPLQRSVTNSYEQQYYTAHIALAGATPWFNPSNITWTVEYAGSIIGYWFQNSRDFTSGPPSDPYNVNAFTPPTITWHGNDGGYNPATFNWIYTPVGYWKITQAIGADYYSSNVDSNMIESPTCWTFTAWYGGSPIFSQELVCGYNP